MPVATTPAVVAAIEEIKSLLDKSTLENSFSLPWDCHCWNWNGHSEVEAFWHQYDIGIESLFPCHFFSGVSAHSTHDGSQGTFGDLYTFVVAQALLDAVVESYVLKNIGVWPIAFESPILFTLDAGVCIGDAL